jgi:hypothetical protein
MSTQPVQASTQRDPYCWRATIARGLVNGLLVLLAYAAVSFAAAAVGMVAGTSGPMTPTELVPLMAVFLLVRWLFVLPILLPVLVAIDFVARRAPHARALTGIVALTPMIAWELTNSPGDFPSVRGAILGLTAVVFAAIARLPARRTPSREAMPPAGSALGSP